MKHRKNYQNRPDEIHDRTQLWWKTPQNTSYWARFFHIRFSATQKQIHMNSQVFCAKNNAKLGYENWYSLRCSSHNSDQSIKIDFWLMSDRCSKAFFHLFWSHSVFDFVSFLLEIRDFRVQMLVVKRQEN